MWIKLLSVVFGVVLMALKLFEHFKKKPEEVVREQDAEKHKNILHDLAHPNGGKPYTVMHNDDTWGKYKGKRS